MSWDELRFKAGAQPWVKGRGEAPAVAHVPFSPGRFWGGTPRRCSSTSVICERVLGKCQRVEMGKCRAEMETWSSHAACSRHGAAPTGADGGDGTRTPGTAAAMAMPALARRSWVGAGGTTAGERAWGLYSRGRAVP